MQMDRETILNMLLAAYKAGFEGPLELAGEVCHEIMDKAGIKQSDLELMTQIQERQQNNRWLHKKAPPDIIISAYKPDNHHNYYENVGY